MRLTRDWLLAATGVVLAVLGAWISINPFRDIVQEAQGHCDYLPCVTLMTAVVSATAFAVTVIGAFVVGLAAGTIRRGS